ncbi:hypothetical protein ACIBEJ_22940 [Nonomuraea sp. NPDC050790]|uniref:hypothetical protein n=1 Tax=Nonomuraea sp. NPDC050790 TaxID=3364371 RepID=UPI003798F26A
MKPRISRPAAKSGAPRVRLPRLAALVLAGGAVLATAGAAHAGQAESPEPLELRLVLDDCPAKVQP